MRKIFQWMRQDEDGKLEIPLSLSLGGDFKTELAACEAFQAYKDSGEHAIRPDKRLVLIALYDVA
jgi:hypothetical protein